MSKIEWTETTWNPTTGCTKISSGCKNCYAEKMSKRLKSIGLEKYQNEFKLTCHIDSLDTPKGWRKPKIIFVNSMSDLFHKDVPLDFIQKVFQTMNDCPQHIFQVLTKRSERLQTLSKYLEWSENIWMGVSVESDDVKFRIKDLVKTPAKVKFLSVEPLIGEIKNIPLTDIDWVIVGGESGPNARPMDKIWVDKIKEKCVKMDVPFFFKQWGGVNKKATGRRLDNKEWNEMPLSF